MVKAKAQKTENDSGYYAYCADYPKLDMVTQKEDSEAFKKPCFNLPCSADYEEFHDAVVDHLDNLPDEEKRF